MRYPDASRVKVLQKEIEERKKVLELADRIQNQSGNALNYPEIDLQDVYGKDQKLSSLDGKTILVSFWSTRDSRYPVQNAEMRELYKTYKDRGLAIYQVSLDDEESRLGDGGADQKLPWINVFDPRGTGGIAAMSYNVQAVPSNVLISSDGAIVARNLFGDQLKNKVAELSGNVLFRIGYPFGPQGGADARHARAVVRPLARRSVGGRRGEFFWWATSSISGTSIERVVPRGFTRLLGKLSGLTDRGYSPSIFFAGNHDLWAFDYLPLRVRGGTLHRGPITSCLDLYGRETGARRTRRRARSSGGAGGRLAERGCSAAGRCSGCSRPGVHPNCGDALRALVERFEP